MSQHEQRVLYDLDQTIIPWDTQLVFRSFVLRREPVRRLLTPIFLVFLPLNKVLGAGGMKRVFHSYLWKMKTKTLEQYADDFVREWLPKICYPEILAEINEQKNGGKTLVLSSASPELWVRKIGQALGFHQALGTRFDWGSRVKLFPDMIGENHKGSEKVRRLGEMGITSGISGYSDSKADLPLLELCRDKTLVNPLPGVRKIGEQLQWRILEPARPWKNRLAFGIGCTQQLFGFWKP